MKSSASESKPFQSRFTVEIPGRVLTPLCYEQHCCFRIQLFRDWLAEKREKCSATTPKDIMGSFQFVILWNFSIFRLKWENDTKWHWRLRVLQESSERQEISGLKYFLKFIGSIPECLLGFSRAPLPFGSDNLSRNSFMPNLYVLHLRCGHLGVSHRCSY